MGLFGKKFCDICGERIKLLGNRKLEDGNLCKDCAKDLSPFFSNRRRSAVSDIKEQLAYREANKADVSAFRVTRTLGEGHVKIMLDEDAGKFIVTSGRKWQEENPDVVAYSQVTGCEVDVDENRDEILRKVADGKKESYNPPRYRYSYDFFVKIYIDSPWFDEIRFKVNNSEIKRVGSPEYLEAERIANEIRLALTEARRTVRESVVDDEDPNNAPNNAAKMPQNCPACSAPASPDASGRCEYCGGALLS